MVKTSFITGKICINLGFIDIHIYRMHEMLLHCVTNYNFVTNPFPAGKILEGSLWPNKIIYFILLLRRCDDCVLAPSY